jgi:catechol 2,3-dioxygenase
MTAAAGRPPTPRRTMPGMPPLPADAHIGEVTLGVSNLERSLSFYTGIIGLTTASRDGSTAALAPAGGRVIVRLEQVGHAMPRPRRSSGLYHFAILVPDRAALGRSLRRLGESRWALSGASDHLVSEALYLDDPDGLGIEIYRDRARETWRVMADGEVAMATEPLDLDGVLAEPGADRPWQGLASGTVMGHVHLHVPDLDTAEAFYCGRVGFTPMLRRYPGALFVAAGGYHHHLGLNIWAGRGAPPPPPTAVGLRGFTIEARDLPAEELRDETTGVVVSLRQPD